MVKMVKRFWKIARRIAIAYLLVGCAYLALFIFVLVPSGFTNLLTEVLFWVFIPVFAAGPCILLEVICDEIGVRIRRYQERDFETRVEAMESEDMPEDNAFDLED